MSKHFIMTVFSECLLGSGPRCFAATSKTILRQSLLLMMFFPGWASAQTYPPPPPPPPDDEPVTCAYSLSPTSRSATAGATSSWLSVITTAACGWTATSNVAWIAISSGSSGNGDGTVRYAVAANSSACSRSGTLTIEDKTFTVSQEANLVAPSCPPDQPIAPPPATQTEYTFVTNVIPDAAVTVTASGTLGSVTLNVILDLSRLAGFFTGQGQFAAGYNVYVVAYVPSGRLGLPAATWFMLPASPGFWTQFGLPMAAYLQNVAQTASVAIGILQNMDMTELIGTEFYIGYGTSDEEMLNSGRYRGVYIAR